MQTALFIHGIKNMWKSRADHDSVEIVKKELQKEVI